MNIPPLFGCSFYVILCLLKLQHSLSRIRVLKYTTETLSESTSTTNRNFKILCIDRFQYSGIIIYCWAVRGKFAGAGIKFVVTHRSLDSRGLLRGNFSICQQRTRVVEHASSTRHSINRRPTNDPESCSVPTSTSRQFGTTLNFLNYELPKCNLL